LVQGYKGFASYATTGRWNLRRFVETGGMPSSHAAGVAALSTSVAIQAGPRSLLFAVTLYFSLVVMYDAAGLRRAAGRQAVILNRLLDEHFKHPERDAHRLMELLGHTPLEVLVGAILVIVGALAYPAFNQLIGKDGMAGLINVDITAELALKMAMAYGTVLKKGARVCTSRDAHPASRVIKRAIISGLNSTGVVVRDLRVASSAINRFEVKNGKWVVIKT